MLSAIWPNLVKNWQYRKIAVSDFVRQTAIIDKELDYAFAIREIFTTGDNRLQISILPK